MTDDLMASFDEAERNVNEANARKVAEIIAAFHRTLIDSGMHAVTAKEIAVLYTKRILFVKEK